jgi:pimeloyl-ACP methyl ester carboxylesterase
MNAMADKVIRLSDGRALGYAEYGSPLGEPVIYCHGAPSSRVEGNLSLHAVAADRGVRLIIPDRPGMGASDFQPGRRIVDWPRDVIELATGLHIDTFAVLGSSGGSPYAAVCGVLIPARVRAIGLIGCLAPFDAPDASASLSAPLRLMFRLARHAPPLLRSLFRLNLKMVRNGGQRAAERMAASFPEPDRTLLRQRGDVARAFMACYEEACRQGVEGPAWDLRLLARPWGFDLGKIAVPVMLWHGERDGNVPVSHGRYLASAIPGCRATLYPDEAHLSLSVNRSGDMLGGLIALAAA